MQSKIQASVLFALILGLMAFALSVLPHYGLVFDSPKNFQEGQINLDHLLSPHPLTPYEQFSLSYQIHGAFFFMLGEALKRLFADTLGWLDPVSARHLYLPLLSISFALFYFIFLKKNSNPAIACLAPLLLLTYPHFFGHSFNNIKDIPLFFSFGSAALSFYLWTNSYFKKTLFLYLFFIALGLALLSKLYAGLSAAILVLWMLCLLFLRIPLSEATPPLTFSDFRPKILIHGIIGCFFLFAFLAVFFIPAFYAVPEKAAFFKFKLHVLSKLMAPNNRQWSFYPFIQIFYVTPIFTLFAAAGGIFLCLRNFRNPLHLLMLIWLTVILVIPCTPLLPVYNGIRLFMTFLVPFSFLAALGMDALAKWLGRNFLFKKFPAAPAWILSIGIIATQIAGIAATHPYETTFFNFFADGLKGAQAKKIPDAGDFWMTAYREAVEWVNQNALPGFALLTPGKNTSLLMVEYYRPRKDIPYDYVRRLPLPRRSLLLVSESDAGWLSVPSEIRRGLQIEMEAMTVVYEIKRQGGTILRIYFKP